MVVEEVAAAEVVVEEEEEMTRSSSHMNIVSVAETVVVMGCMAILHAMNSQVGVKRKKVQDLRGEIIHDDGSGAHGRCNVSDFIAGSLKANKNVVVRGVTGMQENPILGEIQDGIDKIDNVLHLKHQNYGIDSPYVLVEKQGYTEDKTTDHYTKRYFKVVNGITHEKIYHRKKEWTHFVRIDCAAVTELDKFTLDIIEKMDIIHENLGHPPAKVMLNMCDNYDNDKLGFTKFEVRLWAKHSSCKACKEGKAVFRKRKVNGRMVYVQYIDYGNMDGIHFDCFFINQEWGFLLVKSHKDKMQWVFNVGYNFKSDTIRNSLEHVFGDYRYTAKEIGFVRSDADPKFQPLRGWIQNLGLRYYMAPVGIKTSRAERSIRTEKEMIRTLIHSLEYEMPNHWIPYAVEEANYLITIRYNDKLKKSPREAFFNVKMNYKDDINVHFGQIISYTYIDTDSNPKESRLQYGAIVGHDHITGNVYVENFERKMLDKVHMIEEIIPVDESIRTFYLNYDKIRSYKYSKHGNVLAMAALQYELYDTPTIPDGALFDLNVLEKLSFETTPPSRVKGNSIQILNSFEHQALLDGEVLDVQLVDAQDGVSEANLDGDEQTDTEDAYTGSPRHESTSDHAIPALRQDLQNMIEETMAAMNCELVASQVEISAMSAQIINELELKVNEQGLQIQELFINDSTDPHHNLNTIMNIVQMSYKKMHKKRPELTKIAGKAEMKTVSDRDTIHGVHFSDIPQGEKILYIMTKYAEKFKLGEFDKVKARLLLGGNDLYDDYQLRWDEISSRTIALASLYTLITIMAYEQMDILSMDFKNAFLYGILPPKDQCYARVPADESKLLMEIDEAKWKPYYNEKEKCIFVKVVGSLYGHPAAAKIWYDYLAKHLKLIGFEPLKCEPCIFKRVVDGEVELIGLHVDDLLMGSKNGARLKAEMIEFRRKYFQGEGTIEEGPNLEYLNMLFEFNKANRSVEVSQENYWNTICSKFGVDEDASRNVSVPHSSNYMERLRARNAALGPNEESDPQTMKKFLSIVMSVLWGTQRSMPQLGVNCSFLAGEAKHASEEDCKDARRVLDYIAQHKKDKVRFQVKGKVQASCFIDSSAHIGPTMLGQAGIVITIGDEGYGGPIEAKSARSRNNHVGSMMYELDALHHMINGPIFIRELLEEIGYPQGPVIVFEDNKALIDLIRRGKVSTGVTRHIAAKYYYAKDLIAEGIIVLRHCPTKLMIADILTKHMGGPDFKKMSQRLRNAIEQDPTLSDEVYKRLYENSSENVYSDEDKKAVEILSAVIDYLNACCQTEI